ncbi:C1q-related factor-like [Mizuhopecten yessoensis]|uniref:Complement C1q-like protein 4 n=1 Tax=Mizuhopecten yessoensis TaxID=6573 RepID=A0A210QZI9_MIZYE|nr:C1q-related factor-like [Mizuhopecten yessoensis]OWF54132.1 Complement C1q-like protein 4 [Mizuhopecten yessoensis]
MSKYLNISLLILLAVCAFLPDGVLCYEAGSTNMHSVPANVPSTKSNTGNELSATETRLQQFIAAQELTNLRLFEAVERLGGYENKAESCVTEMERLRDTVKRQSREIVELKKNISLSETNICQGNEPADEGQGLDMLSRSRNIPRQQPQFPTQVAFYVQLKTNVANIGNYQTIKFDHVRTNIGGGYNLVTGIFIVPTPGTYVFHWTTVSLDNMDMQTELMIDGIRYGVARSDSGSHADLSSASNVVVASAIPGETIWVRSGERHSSTVEGGELSTFSGWLLF